MVLFLILNEMNLKVYLKTLFELTQIFFVSIGIQ